MNGDHGGAVFEGIRSELHHLDSRDRREAARVGGTMGQPGVAARGEEEGEPVTESEATTVEPILVGVRVLDFTQYVAGPTVTRLMAALGAYVIKVEPAPAGDLMRRLAWIIDGRSSAYVQQNRGKRSLAVNLDTKEGCDLLRRLVPHVDVVAENFGPGVMEKRGLGYPDLAALNPRVIMASVSAFGRVGPLAHRVGYDTIAQAYSGLMHMTGDPDGAPVNTGIAVADTTTGLNCFGALGYALYHRERTGRGQHIDIAMVDTMFQNHESGLSAYAASKGTYVPLRSGRHHPLLCPCGVFRGPKGWIVLIVTDNQWPGLCRAMGHPELEHDQRFDDTPKRTANQVELIGIIEAWMASQPDDDAVIAAFSEHRIPGERIRSPVDALTDPHYLARGMIDVIHDAVLGELKLPGVPLRFSESPVLQGRGAPTLGEHNQEVLGGILGLSAAEVDKLTAAGVLAQNDR